MRHGGLERGNVGSRDDVSKDAENDFVGRQGGVENAFAGNDRVVDSAAADGNLSLPIQGVTDVVDAGHAFLGNLERQSARRDGGDFQEREKLSRARIFT